MADIAEMDVLGSKWGDLSPLLIARFYQVEEVRDSGTGKGRWRRVPGSKIVAAPLGDSASLDIVLNWQSPFEQAGAESKAPNMMAMLQSGALQPLIDVVNKKDSGKTGMMASLARDAQNKSNAFISQFAGRTGITKLNSMQVFSGMPPLKFQVSALFRAWQDAAAEVEIPVDQLMQWAVPEELSQDGTMVVSSIRAAKGENSYVEALMPSVAPTKIFMQYKGRVFGPLVIESVGYPLNSGVTADGKFAEFVLPLTICSLSAIDRADWKGIQNGGIK